MDHANAHLMEFTTDPITTDIISNPFSHREKEHSLGKSEDGMHNKEQQSQHEYYKKLGDIIRNFQDVLLFGPTNAKIELLNLLRADHQFEKIKLETRNSKLETSIIGVGGIMNVQDALDKFKAGSDLIQLYSGFIYSGPALVTDIKRALITH